MTSHYKSEAKPSSLANQNEASEFYQIRIQSELKAEFMGKCREMALNPSAVVRMLMVQWNAENGPARTQVRTARLPAPKA